MRSPTSAQARLRASRATRFSGDNSNSSLAQATTFVQSLAAIAACSCSCNARDRSVRHKLVVVVNQLEIGTQSRGCRELFFGFGEFATLAELAGRFEPFGHFP
jgi:hypothetical protein